MYLVVWCKTLTWWFQVSCLRWVFQPPSRNRTQAEVHTFLLDPVGCMASDAFKQRCTVLCQLSLATSSSMMATSECRRGDTAFATCRNTKYHKIPAEDGPPFERTDDNMCVVCFHVMSPFCSSIPKVPEPLENHYLFSILQLEMAILNHLGVPSSNPVW